MSGQKQGAGRESFQNVEYAFFNQSVAFFRADMGQAAVQLDVVGKNARGLNAGLKLQADFQSEFFQLGGDFKFGQMLQAGRCEKVGLKQNGHHGDQYHKRAKSDKHALGLRQTVP